MNRQSPTAADLNTEQTYLKRIDMRIKNLVVNAPGSSELSRMQAAREDVMTRLSPSELAGYEAAVNTAKSREELAAEAEAERLAMEANKDKPAI
jgi:hypothetical protein